MPFLGGVGIIEQRSAKFKQSPPLEVFDSFPKYLDFPPHVHIKVDTVSLTAAAVVLSFTSLLSFVIFKIYEI